MLRFMVLVSSVLVLGGCGSSGPAGSGGGGGSCPNVPFASLPMPDALFAAGQRNLLALDDTRLFSTTPDNYVLAIPKSGGEEVIIGQGNTYEGLTAGASDLYLSAVGDVILRLAKDGTSQSQIADQQLGAASASQGITTDDAHVYWLGEGLLPIDASPPTMGFLRRSDLDGGNIVDLATGLRAPASLLVDGGLAIWAEQSTGGLDSIEPPDGAIHTVPVAGGPVTTLVSGLATPLVRAHRDGFVWFGGGADLYRVPDTGGTPTLMVPGAAQSAIGATNVFWVELVASAQRTILLRAPITGGCATPIALVDGAFSPLAIDDTTVYVAMPEGVLAVKQ